MCLEVLEKPVIAVAVEHLVDFARSLIGWLLVLRPVVLGSVKVLQKLVPCPAA